LGVENAAETPFLTILLRIAAGLRNATTLLPEFIRKGLPIPRASSGIVRSAPSWLTRPTTTTTTSSSSITDALPVLQDVHAIITDLPGG
jgi:hypothetical protein